MLYIACFEDSADVLVDGDDADGALENLRDNGIDATPTVLREVPPKTLCCEILWATDDEEAAEDNPANVSSEGVVLEPLERFADFLEIDARAVNADRTTATELPDAG